MWLHRDGNPHSKRQKVSSLLTDPQGRPAKVYKIIPTCISDSVLEHPVGLSNIRTAYRGERLRLHISMDMVSLEQNFASVIESAKTRLAEEV